MVQVPQNFENWVDRLPPQNVDAEEAILGCLLLDPAAINRVMDTLRPEAFFIDCHKEIYKAALAVHASGQPVDLITVANWLHSHERLELIGGQSKLAELVSSTVSSVNVDRYAALLVDKYYRRRLIEVGHEIAQLGHEDWISQEALSAQIEQKLFGKKGIFNHFKSEQQRSMNQYEQMIAAVEEIELTIENPGFKLWEYQRIANKFGTSVKRLEDLWYRHLIATGNSQRDVLQDIRAEANEVQEWLLHGFLPKQGLVLLHATAGIGKTRLFYDWAFCVTTGQSWNELFSITKQRRRVLFIQTDELASEMLLALEARGFDETNEIAFVRNWDIHNTAALKKHIEEFNPDLILIDSLNSVSANSLVSENDAEYARPVLALRKLSETYNKLIFLIHHSNKEGDIRGTSAIKAACSMEMKLSRDPQFPQQDSGRRVLTLGKTRSYRRPAEYSVEFDPDTGQWIWLGEHSKKQSGDSSLSLKERIVEFLSNHRNQRFEYEEIHQELGGGLHSVRRAACELAADGIISRVKRNRRSLFFLMWEGDPTSPPNYRYDQRSVHDHNDHNYDHSGNAHPVSSAEICDRMIAKNAIPKLPTDEENLRSHDRKEDSVVQELESVDNTAYDRAYDPVTIVPEKCDHKSETLNSSLQCSDNCETHHPPTIKEPQRMETPGAEVERWQVGDRVRIVKAEKKHQHLISQIGEIYQLSMAGCLRIKVGRIQLTCEPTAVNLVHL